MSRKRRVLEWCCLVPLIVLGCSGARQRISTRQPSDVSAEEIHVWKSYPQDEFRTWTIYSSDGKLQVTVVDEKDHRAWWYAVQIRLHHVEAHIPEVVFSWIDAPGASWYPLFTHALRVSDPDDDIYVLLGWTAEGIGRPILHAWWVTIKNDSMVINKLSFRGGRRIRLVLSDSGGLRLFLPEEDPSIGRPWADPDDPKICRRPRCRAVVNGKEITDEQLQARSSPAPSRVGFWYTRGRFMDIDPGPGRACWVGVTGIPESIPTTSPARAVHDKP